MDGTSGFFVVKHKGTYLGPFLDNEVGFFTSTLAPGSFEICPLIAPKSERERLGSAQAKSDMSLTHRERADVAKIDSELALAGVMQAFLFAREAQRVLVASEIVQIWSLLFDVSKVLNSLMHYAEVAVADPRPEQLTALRKALWRNRGCDDVDPHYGDRFW